MVITEDQVKKILDTDKIEYSKCKKLRCDSGQKQVFFITLNKVEYVFKIVDVTPYSVYDELNINNDYIREEQPKELVEIIDGSVEIYSKRLNTEIKMSKKCSNLPQLKIYEDIKTIFLDNYYYLSYYIEEYFDGSSLLYAPIYKLKEVINFLNQMIDNINIMYSSGYVHRDIKPGNIIEKDGIYRIIDGGLGKNIKEEEGNSILSNNSLGTPGYYAPEQVNYPPNYPWDFKTDFYPIGIIAIEMYMPELRRQFIILRNLEEVYDKWKVTFSDDQLSMKFFRDIIVMLSSSQKLNRFNSINDCKLKLNEILSEVIE